MVNHTEPLILNMCEDVNNNKVFVVKNFVCLIMFYSDSGL